jgi:hypothetical protein
MDTRIRRRAAVTLLAALATAPAFSAPPAAPGVATRADIKQLIFDWSDIPGARRYEFLFSPAPGAPYTLFSEPPRSQASNRVSAHLLDWDDARYQVRACNAEGCGVSAPIAVDGLMHDAIGYFKSSHPVPGGGYGSGVALSEDGLTLAVSAPFEGSTTATYVYRLSQGRWREEARLDPSPSESSSGPAELRLSYDGNTLAMAADISVGGLQGIVYLFRRVDGSWQLEQTLHGEARADEWDSFGLAPTLTQPGDGLLVSYGSGRSEIYARRATGWRLYKTFRAHPEAETLPVMSGDLQVLARCVRIDGAVAVQVDRTEIPDEGLRTFVVAPASADHHCGSIALDYLGATIAVGHVPRPPVTAAWNPRVALLRASGATYVQVATLAPGAWQETIGNRPSNFGEYLALSWYGDLLAVGDPNDSGAGHGVMPPPLAQSGIASGAVYVFLRRGGGYGLRSVLKPHVTDAPDYWFGTTLSFGDRGRMLAVGHRSERSAAFGIGGNRDDTSLDFAGAVWLY